MNQAPPCELAVCNALQSLTAWADSAPNLPFQADPKPLGVRLNCVAKSLGASPERAVTGREATEKALKSAPLNRFRILHFATHGFPADTARLSVGLAEPALVLRHPEHRQYIMKLIMHSELFRPSLAG
jgi:hypothetical protein